MLDEDGFETLQNSFQARECAVFKENTKLSVVSKNEKKCIRTPDTTSKHGPSHMAWTSPGMGFQKQWPIPGGKQTFPGMTIVL